MKQKASRDELFSLLKQLRHDKDINKYNEIQVSNILIGQLITINDNFLF